MGIIDLQVVHQKAKNSTSCGLPVASFTFFGSLGVNSLLIGFAGCATVGWGGAVLTTTAAVVG